MGRPGGDRSRWYNLFFFLLSRSFAHWLCSFAFPLKEVCLMRAELLQLRPHSNCLMLRLTWLVIWYSASCAKPFEFVIHRFRFPLPRRFFSSLFSPARVARRDCCQLSESKYLNYRNSRQLNNLVPTFPYKKVAWRLILSNVNNTCTWRRCYGNIYANEYLTRAPKRERWEHQRTLCSITTKQ